MKKNRKSQEGAKLHVLWFSTFFFISSRVDLKGISWIAVLKEEFWRLNGILIRKFQEQV